MKVVEKRYEGSPAPTHHHRKVSGNIYVMLKKKGVAEKRFRSELSGLEIEPSEVFESVEP